MTDSDIEWINQTYHRHVAEIINEHEERKRKMAGPEQDPKAIEKKPEATTAVAKKPWNIGLAGEGMALMPRNFEEMLNFAQMIAATDFVPRDFQGKAGAVLAAVQFGNELGLTPMAALQSVAIVNGRPSLWGDGALAVLKSHPLCEWVHELGPDEALAKGFGECSVKRRGDDQVVTRRFSKEMAEQAGLWGGKSKDASKKQYEPWFLYPGRMLMMRARSWAMRDAIPEAFRGIHIAEEARDEPRDVTPQPDRPAIQAPARLSEQTAETASEIPEELKPEPQPEPKEEPKPEPAPIKLAIFDEMRQWLQSATREEFFAPKNFVDKNMAKLTDHEKVEVCKIINELKQEYRKSDQRTA